MWRWRARSLLLLFRSSAPHHPPLIPRAKSLTLLTPIPTHLPPPTTTTRLLSSAHQTLESSLNPPPPANVQDPASASGPAPDPSTELDAAEPALEDDQELTFVDPEQLDTVLSILRTASEETLDSELDNTELAPGEEFLSSVVESLHIPAGNLIRFFRWAASRIESPMSARIVALLVSVVADSEEIGKEAAYKLWDFVRESGEEDNGLVSTEILNRQMALFRRLGKAKAGLEVFDKFEDFGCIPDGDSYYLTIEALGTRSMVGPAWSVCEKMIGSKTLPDEKKIGEIISFFSKNKKVKEAHLVYQTAKENKMSPPKSSLDWLISGLSRSDETVRDALELIEDYTGSSNKYANKTFSAVIKGLCRVKDVQDAKRLLLRMVDSGPPPGNAAFNYVITGLSKVGEMEDAVSLMKVMERRGLRPDVYTYTVVMSGFTKGGLMEEAREIFYEAKRRHAQLSPATYHILTRGYCKLEEFDKAVECLEEMKKDGVQPNKDEYTKMIESLCLKALDWRTAQKLSEEMKESGLYLQGTTRSLIAAVRELEEEGGQLEEAKIEA